MGTTIDHHVTSVEFDNSKFEKYANQSLSTIEKLKRAFSSQKYADGFDGVSKSIQKSSSEMNGLEAAVQTVHAKFSALDVIAYRTLSRIADKALDTGERLVKSLSIDQITQGWSKYGEKTSAVQTIMAATAKDFTDTAVQMAYVNEQLDKLNFFTDETSYNFLDMVNNIGKFTSQGIALTDANRAMQGIANWAAISGAGIQGASRAMYNLSQAIGVGAVKLQDWKSIENANMATVEFKETALETAVAMGKLKKVGKGMYEVIGSGGKKTEATIATISNFNQTLQKGWFTSDVLMATLDKYGAFADRLGEIYNQIGGNTTTSELLRAIDDYVAGDYDAVESYAKRLGMTAKEISPYLEELSSDTYELGRRSFAAAQEAKTFGEAIDATKDAVSTGWSKTFELIFGDYEKAKELWTGLSEVLYDIFAAPGNARNDFLTDLMPSSWEQLSKVIQKTGISLKEWEAALIENSDYTKEDIDAMGGFEASLESGWVKAKDLVKVIDQYNGQLERTNDETKTIQYQIDQLGGVVKRVINGEFGEGEDRIKALTEAGYDATRMTALAEKVMNGAELSISDLTAAEIKNIDKSELQAAAFKELSDALEDPNSQVGQLADSLSYLGGRTLILTTISNLFEGISKRLGAIRDAFRSVFAGPEAKDVGVFLQVLKDLSAKFADVGDDAEKIQRTFTGVFSVLKALGKLITTPIKAAFKVFDALLGGVNIDFLGFTAIIGDNLAKFANWIDELGIAEAAVEGLSSAILFVINGIKNIGLYIASMFQGVDFSNGIIQPLAEIGRRLISGKVSFKEFGAAIKDVFKNVGENAHEAGEKLSTAFSTASDTFTSVLKKFVSGAYNFFTRLKDILSQYIGFSEIMAAAIAVASIALAKETLKIAQSIAAPFEAAAKLIKSWANICNKFAEGIKFVGYKYVAAAIKEIALAVLLLSASVFVLSKIDTSGLIGGLIGITVILAEVGALTALLMSTVKAMDKMDVMKTIGLFMTLTVGLVAVALAMKTFANIGWQAIWNSLIAFSGVLGIMVGIEVMMGKINHDRGTIEVKGLISTAIAIFVIAQTLKGFENISFESVIKGLIATGGAILLLGTILNNVAKVKFSNSAGILVLSVGILALYGALKVLSKMDFSQMGEAIVGLVGLFGALALLSRIAGQASDGIMKVGIGLAAVAGALNLALIAVKSLRSVPANDIFKGTAAVVALMAAMALIVKATSWGGKDQKNNAIQAGLMLVAMTSTLAVASAMIVVLSHLDAAKMIPAALAVLGLILALSKVVEAAGSLQKAVVPMVALNVAIGLMVGAVVLLSLMPNPLKQLTSVAALGALFLAFAKSMEIIGKQEGFFKKLGPSLALMLGVTVALAAVVAGMATVDANVALPNVLGLSILMLAFATAMKIMGGVKEISSDAYKSIGMMGLVSAGLGLIVGLLGQLDPKKAVPNSLALGVLINAFAASMVVLGKAQKVSEEAKKAILPMGIIAGALGALIALLSTCDPKNAVPNALGLSVVLNAFASAMLILSKCGDVSTSLVDVMWQFTAVATALAGIIAIFSLITNVEAALTVSTALSELLLAFSTSLLILSNCNQTVGPAQTAVWSMVGVTAVLATIIGILSNIPNIQNALTVSTALSELLLAMSISMGIAGLVGPLAAAGVTGMYSLLAFIGVVGIVAVAIGSLTEMFPQLEEFLTTGLSLLAQIGNGLGQVVGGIVAGFGEAVSEAFPAIMGNIVDGVNKFEDVKETAITGAKSAAGVIVAIGAAQIFNALGTLLSFFTGKKSSDLVDNFTTYGQAIHAFSDNVTGINLIAVSVASEAAKKIIEGIKGLPTEGGLKGLIFGNTDWKGFTSNVENVGDAIAKFSNKVSGKVDLTAVENGAEAGKKITELIAAIPSSGGKWQWFFGENDFAGFSKNLVDYGDALVKFGDKVSSGITVDVFENAKKAGLEVVELINNLPDTGGKWQAFFGGKDYQTFSAMLPQLGKDIVSYGESIMSLPEGTIKQADAVGQILSNLATNVPESGGFLSVLFGGDQNFEVFGKQLASLGESVVAYSESVAKVNLTGTSSAMLTLTGVIGFARLLSDAKFSNDLLSGFGSQLASLGRSLVEYSSYVSTLDFGSMDSAHDFILKTIDAFDKDPGAIEQLASKLRSVAETSSQSLLDGFSSVNDKIFKSGTDTINNYIDGVEQGAAGKELDLQKTASNIGRTLDAGVRSFLGIHSPSTVGIETGGYYADGLIQGVKEKESAAQEVGGWIAKSIAAGVEKEKSGVLNVVKNLGAGIENTIRDRLQIHSLSPLFAGIGKWLPKSMSQGVTDGTGGLLDSVKDMGSKVLGTNTSVIGGLINSAKEKVGDGIGAISGVLGNGALDIFNNNFANYTDVGNSLGGALDGAIGKGIKSSSASTDAVSEKTKQILEAFSKQLSLLSSKESYQNADYELWQAREGKTANEMESAAKAIENATEAVENQKEKVTIAEQKLAEVLSAYGEGSKEAYDAATELKQAEKELISREEALAEKQKALPSEAEMRRKETQAYVSYLQEYQEAYKLLEMTDEQLQSDAVKYARKLYNLTAETSSLIDPLEVAKDMKMSEVIEAAVDEAAAVADERGGEVGEALAASTSEAVVENSGLIRDGMNDAINTSGAEAAVTAAEQGAIAGRAYADSFNSTASSLSKAFSGGFSISVGNGFEDLGRSAGEGYAKGVNDSTKTVSNATSKMTDAGMKATAKAQDSHSPSKKYQKLGSYAGEGYVMGILGYIHASEDAAKDLTSSTIQTMTSAVAEVSDRIQNGFDAQPVITPVLDLSNVTDNLDRMNGMLSQEKALSISASIAGREEEAGYSGHGNVTNNTFTFNQTNNSPKALSRREIYRQTRNQFSMLKGRVTGQ